MNFLIHWLIFWAVFFALWIVFLVMRKRHVPKAIFGKSTHPKYSLTQSAHMGIFLREEPLWPLFTSVVKFKLMNPYQFDKCVRMLTTNGEG